MEEPLVPLWNQFRGYLKVRLEVRAHDDSAGKAVLAAIIENTAPSTESFPNVTFVAVEALVTVASAQESVQVDRLGPGESHEQLFPLEWQDVATCNATVSGSVSFEAFSLVRSETKAASGEVGLAAYLQVFDWLDVQSMLQELREPFVANSSTTLGEIEAKKADLQVLARDVSRRKERLKPIMQMIKPETARQAAIPHHNAVDRYLQDVSSALGLLQQSVGGEGSPRINLKQLESQAQTIIEQAAKLRLPS